MASKQRKWNFLILKLNRPFYKPESAIIIDVDWLGRLFNSVRIQRLGVAYEFFTYVEPKDIVEWFASIPTQRDCNEFIWMKIEERLPEDYSERIDLFQVELLIEILIELYYAHLEMVFPGASDNYIFHKWIDDSSMMLIYTDS